MIRMEAIKAGGGGGGRVGVGVGGEEDMADGMQCSFHPFRNNPGGICAFCLQEKLGKLVSSSFPLSIRPSSTSSSSSPSFRSDLLPSSTSLSTATVSSTVAAASSSLSISAHPTSGRKNGSDSHCHEYNARRARLPFLLAKKKKKASANYSSSSSSSSAAVFSGIIFKRSKSTATPRRCKFLDDPDDDIVIQDYSPRKRNGFWSFLYLSSKSSSSKNLDAKSFRDNNNSPRVSSINLGSTSATAGSALKQKVSSLGRKNDIVIEEDSNFSPGSHSQATASGSSLERKVSRSRSVGCGSRSFSGDFFERISTGFGDCTLRRVESQREGKQKIAAGSTVSRGGDNHHHHNCMKERVRCGGIFSGFMLTSSSSSSSSSSY